MTTECDRLREACEAGAKYSNALKAWQDKGMGGSSVESDDANCLDELFEDWHDKTHAALDGTA